MYSYLSGIKLEIDNRKTPRKSTEIYKLHNILLNNPLVKGEIRSIFELNENENTVY